MGGICDSPKFKMAAVGQFDHCVLNGLAYIAALDLGSGLFGARNSFMMSDL